MSTNIKQTTNYTLQTKKIMKLKQELCYTCKDFHTLKNLSILVKLILFLASSL